MLVLANNSPNDHPLTVPPAIKRKIIASNTRRSTVIAI